MTDRAAAGRATYVRNSSTDGDAAEAAMSDRAVAVISALVGQGVTDERLEVHLALARRNDVDDEGLTALMVLLTAHLGQPHASMAMAAVRRTAGSVDQAARGGHAEGPPSETSSPVRPLAAHRAGRRARSPSCTTP